MPTMPKRIAKTLSLFAIMGQYPTREDAIRYFECVRWGDSPVCTKCGCDSKVTAQKKHPGRYWCGDCRSYFTALTGTPMEYGKVDPRKWIFASYLLMTARKGISAMQLSKEISVHYATAWYMLHRLRLACGNNMEALGGVVEMDATYIGGKRENMSNAKQKAMKGAGRGAVGKTAVVGMRERNGHTKAVVVERENAETVKQLANGNIAEGATVCTDEARAYNVVSKVGFDHRAVNHSAKEYVNGMASTNGIESVWAVLKRGYNGVYHNWSKKHCQAYVNEFAFRLNQGNCERDTQDTWVSALFRLWDNGPLKFNEVNQMSEINHEVLWTSFPKTLPEFNQRFPDEASCRDYLLQVRWGGQPTCPRCGCEKTWVVHTGKHFECASCGHQTSITAGTLMNGTRKPLSVWFRAIWEVCVHKQGISAKDLQRVMGFGSYETAWTWLHKIRRALVDQTRRPLTGVVEMDEGFIGGKGSAKSIALVAAERGGRIRFAQAPSNDQGSIKRFVDQEIDEQAIVVTDGLASYNDQTLSDRPHAAVVQDKLEKQAKDSLQQCHWAISNLKRWLLGTHHGAVSGKHLQAYLDEFTFRYNRRKTQGIGRLAARTLQFLVQHSPLTRRDLVENTQACRLVT